jgi:hypothetical protein
MPSWLPASVILAIAADLGLLYAWIVSSVEENCGDGGDGSSCSKLVRDLAPTALVVMVLVTLALLAFGVYASGRSRRGSNPGFFECKACGARSQGEEEAIDHAERTHRLMTYPEMEASWTSFQPLFECKACGVRSQTEEEAIQHADRVHGLVSYPEMKASWTRL